ncbi:MAG: PSD1 and planctomycete cytochrome C domain-containing protein [Isosphaeraceae bacterium]
MRFGLTTVCLVLVCLPGGRAPGQSSKGDAARVVLARCASCHGNGPEDEDPAGGLDLTRREAALRGGESGPAVRPGDAAASLIVKKVAAGKMPPKQPLPPAEVEALKAWVTAGADWAQPISREETTRAVAAAAAARPTLWSLSPLSDPKTPTVKDRGWPLDPIDAFVLARLEAEGLKPSAESDRGTYLRRVTFDLIGLPPTPEEVEAFENDRSPDAHERVVDRLLASPHYGERWGRHWLDLARFAESQGFEYDRIRENSWPYRDYVIRSLNEDKPYDRFVAEQVAGDVLAPDSAEAVAATGFLVAGPWDEAGSVAQSSSVMRERVREDELEDMVSAVGATFLGLTVHCARCHDHKFDPIPQRDYYRLKAGLEGVRHGNRPIPGPQRGGKPPMGYVANSVKPPPTHVLARGDVTKKGELVAPGGLSAVTTISDGFGVAPDSSDADRRKKLAAWLTDPANPLTPRVLVNRLWHYHFGTGLVGTPSDFGANGERPTHPELLDRLARDFRDGGWRLKPIHRRIVLSRTYRQASALNPSAAAKDSEARLLWRFPPRRLEGEAVRDAMLAVAGRLNARMEGPGYRPFVVRTFNSSFYDMLPDPSGPEFDRRTVYKIHVNSAKSPLLDVLDCPDPSVKTPRRGVTTTPLQALGLMNDPFVQRMSRTLADRVRAEAGPDPAREIERAFRLVLGRAPRPAEASEARSLLERDGLDGLAWVLFNTNEFLSVR